MPVTRTRLATVAGCVTTLLVVTVLARDTAAQTPDPAQATPPAAPAGWQGNAVVSVSLQNGVSDSRTISLSGEAFRNSPGWSYAVQGDHTHSSVRLGPEYETVADSQTARVTAERGLTELLFFVIRPAFKRNEVQAVDYRVEGLLGLGVRLLRKPRAQFEVIGAGGAITQDKNVPEVDGTHAVVGVVQSSQFVISPTWNLSELAVYLHPISAGDDYRLQFQTTLTGAITGPLALNLSFSTDRENIVLGGSEQADRRLSIGVQVNF